jgi:hypothetical protein
MKRLIFIVVLLNFCLAAYSQIIRGTILDKETNSPISYAVVYFDGTSVASYTDEKGFFKLDIKKNSSMPLTISALGYFSTIINDFSPDINILVFLAPKVFEMQEVAVNARGNPEIRRQNLEIFRREFFGRTGNAKECEIINEDDIRFITSPDKDTLKAYSLKPIFIINKGLGYKITYYLNKFEYIKSEYLHQLIGTSLFDEDTTSGSDKQNFIIRRNNAYFGSKMQFIRSLWQDDLKSAGYNIKNSKHQVTYNDLVRNQLSTDPGQHRKYIFYSEAIPIILSIKWEPGKAKSGMEILRYNIFFDKNGYYKGPGIIWHGEMAKQGIADLLPYDYQPFEIVKDKSDTDFRIVDTLSADHIDNQVAESTEKVYLHTDRDFYNPGDDIWFKSYVVDGLTHKLSDSSGNLHVEFISPASKIIDSKIIRLDNGLGNGDFALPDGLQSGKYRLRAYTNYMRNFGDQLFFNKDITIINSSDTAGIAEGIKYSDNTLEISFFPEGGSLVDNVSSIVAFKAVNSGGSGCDVSGEIYSTSGNLITTFRSTHLGMGTFTIKPVPGFNYYATVKNSEGNVIKREIPKSFSKGFVLNTQVNQRNEHLITLKTNPETLPRYLGRDLLITVSAHKKYLKALIVKPDKLDNSFILPAEELPDGIVMITLFGLDNQPLCERLIYIQNKEEVNLIIESDKKVYKLRDSVSVRLSLLEDLGAAQEVFLSLSATENIYTDRTSQFPTTISSWFLLESDVRGPVEEPSYYFDPANPNRLRDLDLLLLTQGWRDFEWKYKGMNYLPESGFTISGRLRKSLIDAPVINSNVTIGIFQGGKSIITTVQTDSSGRFLLDLDNLTGSAEVIVSATDQKGNFKGRLILDSLRYLPVEVQESAMRKSLPRNVTQQETENITLLKETDIIKKSIIRKYTLSDTIMIDEVTIVGQKKVTPQEFHINQSRTLYNKPDAEVIITPELASLRSIKDLLIGRVAGVYPIQQGSGIRIRGYGSSFEMSSEPLFVLDGLVVTYQELSTVPIDWIDRIDVIKSEKTTAFGVRGANGVISVITKTYKEIPYKPVSYSANTNISGYDAPRIFYSPKHSSALQSDYRPDLRSTLYWFPDIKVITNKDYELKYYNADISSTYNIIVEGITSGGIPVTGKIEYEVK